MQERKQSMGRRIMAVLTAVTLCCFSAVAAAQTATAAPPTATGSPSVFVFQDGITWSSTPAQVLEAEGLDSAAYAAMGELQACPVSRIPDGVGADLGACIFLSDQLLITVYQFTQAELLSRYLETLSALYGPPNLTDVTRFVPTVRLIRSNNPMVADAVDDFALSDIKDFVGWALEDGTLIVSVSLDSTHTLVMFIHESRVRAAAPDIDGSQGDADPSFAQQAND